MTRRQVGAEQLAVMLRGVLGEIDAGRLDASVVFRARIEGAVVALDVVLGADAAREARFAFCRRHRPVGPARHRWAQPRRPRC